MTHSKAPPVPPENRSDKGTGEPAQAQDHSKAQDEGAPDTSKQGHQGNTTVNLTPRLKNQDR
jgi:hypothetical protein